MPSHSEEEIDFSLTDNNEEEEYQNDISIVKGLEQPSEDNFESIKNSIFSEINKMQENVNENTTNVYHFNKNRYEYEEDLDEDCMPQYTAPTPNLYKNTQTMKQPMPKVLSTWK